jgi:hypothetical protein
MATIERRKSRGKIVYYARVSIKGQAQSATFHSLSEARQWAKRVEVGILEGKVSPVMAPGLPHDASIQLR